MKEFIQFNVEDRKLFEDFLNDMSEKGYSIKKMDALSITFEKSNLNKYYYVDLYDKLLDLHNDYSKEEKQKQIDLYDEMGLTLKYEYQHFMIYESDTKLKLHTDNDIEFNVIKRTKNRIFFNNKSSLYLLLGSLLIITGIIISLMERFALHASISLSVLFVLSIIYFYKKMKEMENKSIKTIKDMYIRANAYINLVVGGLLITLIPVLSGSSNIISAFSKYLFSYVSIILFILMHMIWNRLRKISKNVIISIAVVLLSYGFLNGYLMNPLFVYVQEYEPYTGNIKGNVDVEYYLEHGEEFEIGADVNGYAVFKNPILAFATLKSEYKEGIEIIQKEYNLMPLTQLNYHEYMNCGRELNSLVRGDREKANFVVGFMDIYENSYKLQW